MTKRAPDNTQCQDSNPRPPDRQLIITVKEARKIMGKSAAKLTTGELTDIIAGYTELIRLELRRTDVRKIEVIESQHES